MRLKLVLTIGFLSAFIGSLQAQTSKSGAQNWSDPNAWVSGVVPGASDLVTIPASSIVTVDITTATASTTTVNGYLKFSRTKSSTLTLVGGNITPNNGGTLDMGTATDQISNPAVKAMLILAKGTVSQHYGLSINFGGRFLAYGADKGHSAVALTNAPASATSVIVSSEAWGWQAGDMIALGQTEPWDASFTVQTETRTIASTDYSVPNQVTVSWTGGLAYNHKIADGPFRVANLTRNVVVMSSGTNHAVDTASVGAFQQPIFTAVNAEFAMLGNSTVDGVYAIACDISSCTFHHNSTALYLENLTAVGYSIQYSVIALNSGDGIAINTNISGTARGNEIFGNGNGLTGGGPSVVRSNLVYGNQQDGIFWEGSRAIIAGNDAWLNGSHGIDVGYGTANVVESNRTWRNDIGFNYGNDVGNVSLKNESFSNASNGVHIDFNSSGNVFGGNQIYSNGATIYDCGVFAQRGSQTNVFVGDYVYGNGCGFDFSQSTGNAATDEWIDYDPAGNSYPSSGGAITNGSLLMKNTHINPGSSIQKGSLNGAGNYFVSYNQNADTGTVRVWGDYAAPGDMLLDRAQNLYEASVTAPILLRGAGHSATVTLVPANDGVVVSQVVMIRYTAANNWVVEGSSSGVLATFTGSQSGLAVPSGTPWFHLDFTQGTAVEEDRLMFVLQASSKDAGRQKKLLFAGSDPSWNGGKARLTVGPGSSLVLRGTAAQPTLVDTFTATSPYYTLVSSGALTIDHAVVGNMDSQGLQAAGAGPVFLAYSTFTNLGADSTGQRTYMALSALTSNATFYGMAFNATGGRTNSTSYGIVVQEPSPNLRWYFPDAAAGGLIGDADTLQSVRRIYWPDTIPPATPPVFLAVPSATMEGEVSLSWTSPGDDGMSLPILGGSFLIFESTDALTAASAVPSQAQQVIPVVSASTGSSQAFMWDGLRPGSTHYFELWAADEWVNNISTVPATQSAWCPVMTIPALTGLTVGRTVGVALSTSATATFTKPMDLASMSMAGAVSWTLVKDHLGVSTNAAMGFTVSSNTAGNVITIAPTAPLAGNGTYVVTVTTAAKDVFGMNLSTSTTIRFTTILDLADHNVITEGLCGATIDVSSGSLPVNGYFTGTGLSPSDVAGATDKLVSATGDSLRRPLPGSVVNFVFNDAAGTPQSTLAAPFQIALSYSPDASRPGFIDGSQARVKTLAVYWLDAAHNLWVKSPSALDPAACTVRAPVPRFATFALMAQADTDLSAAYAFPSPFIASKSSDGKIWFTGLGQSGTIRIYTSEGRLVRELSIEGGTEQWAWDVRNDSGEPVASGLYSYVIKNDKESKTGRLAVIR